MVARAYGQGGEEGLGSVLRPWGERALATLLERIGRARLVLIGEASHGTHEFYALRAEISRRLIAEKGFGMVVAEADWPDAYRVNRYVRGYDDDPDAAEALAGFSRFPQWMWRNSVVLDFVGWLRAHNHARARDGERCGFYGMDMYSLHTSIGAVLEYLERVDPPAAVRARLRYGCFEDYGIDPQAYGHSAALGKTCEAEVVGQLVDLQRRAGEYARRDGRVADDEYFYAEQNARLVKNAEEYYRTMFAGHAESWNRRDRHMVETLAALGEFWERRLGGPAKMIVWAHNSHLGDARATERAGAGELNVGQLVRELWGKESFNVGFSTYSGTVTAAGEWDGPAERKAVRDGLPGSYERLFHDQGTPDFLVFPGEARAVLGRERLQRAIGVIYRARTERLSHYFHARLADQFDAMIHIDRTRSVQPLERAGVWSSEPETYPTGI